MPVGTSRNDRQVVFALEKKSEKIFENIFLQNGVLAALGSNKRVKIVVGGNRFDERIHLGENPNFAHRARTTQIPTSFANNWRTAQYGQAIVDGAAIVNLVEIDQAQGTHKLDDIMEKSIEEALNTVPNVVADALMATTSGANDPLSIIETIETTAFGSQTSSLGGVSRSTFNSEPGAWQNQFSSSAIVDIGSAAGKSRIEKFAWDCSPGGSARNQQPDIGLTSTGVFAKFTGGDDDRRRFSPSDKMLKLGFDNVLINNAAVMADKTMTNLNKGELIFLNTNYMRLQVLKGPRTKVTGDVITVGDGKQAIPLQVRPPIESEDHLNVAIKMYMVYNLTFGGLRQHGRQTNITEA